MDRTNARYFYESAAERERSGYEELRSSFGAMQKGEGALQTFEERFNDLYQHYKEDAQIDIKKDIGRMLGDREFMNQYKVDLMGPVFEAFRAASPNDPHIESIIENVERFWDTKVKSYTESASMTGFLPIATLEFPVLVKQFFGSVLKDIIEVESVKSPNITKHIRTTYLVNNQTGEELEYPKCMFNGEWEAMWDAAKGHKIKHEWVPLTAGRLFKYDIITGLTDGIRPIDKLSYQIRIIGVKVGGKEIQLTGNGITVEFSTNGTFVNGDLNFTAPDGTVVNDTLAGRVNFRDGTVDIACAAGTIEAVMFDGYLSNEANLRSVSVRERRQILRFVIEDGARWNMPFSIEEIEDAAALLDLNYYNRMVDEIVRTQEMQECMTVIKFLNDEFAKFNGVKTDTYALESLAMTREVDLEPPNGFAGDPFKYISTTVQFHLKAVIHMLTELTKLDGLSFVIVGNPMATQLLSEFTQWKSQQGTNIGGIDVNSSYGFATDMGANIRVVASNLYDAYTVNTVAKTGKRELVIHIYGYPTSAEHISFKHLKFTSHLMTSQSQTAYQSTQAPGGAYNIVTATSRFKDIAVQGISADLIFLNSEKVYGEAFARPPINGAPWDGVQLPVGP